MHVNFEYILAGLMIFLILTMTELTMFTIMSQQLTALEQESGYTMADRVLDALLLSPGDPPDWGCNLSKDPISLGLADQNSLRVYVLDPYKVVRLYENSTGYISPAKARSLLGLRRDCHFSIKITPIFLIEVEGNGTFTITVKNNEGFPVSNVKITAYYVPRSLSPDVEYFCESNITRTEGTCTLEFEFRQDYILVVQAEQSGVKVVATDPPGLNLKIEGDRVFESDIPLVVEIDYSTGSISGSDKETTSRCVEIGGSTYLVEFTLWS